MFEEVNNENVVDFEYGDYNKDGTHEAFVLTNDNGYKLWYMHDQGCELVIEKFTEDEKISVDKVDYSTKSYLFLHRVENGKKNTLVYTIDNADGYRNRMFREKDICLRKVRIIWYSGCIAVRKVPMDTVTIIYIIIRTRDLKNMAGFRLRRNSFWNLMGRRRS